MSKNDSMLAHLRTEFEPQAGFRYTMESTFEQVYTDDAMRDAERQMERHVAAIRLLSGFPADSHDGVF